VERPEPAARRRGTVIATRGISAATSPDERPSRGVRRRVALELAVLAAAASLVLALVRDRPPVLEVGLALLGLGLVGLSAKDTRDRVWGPPAAPRAVRARRAARQMTVVTLAGLVVFAAVGAWPLLWSTGAWGQVGERLFRPTALAALVLFVPWALVQQTLFQFYLLGRLRALAPGARPSLVAAANGLLFGLVHLPDWEVTALTVLGGSIWSLSYLRDRCLAPVALSHAALGTTYFCWVRDTDLALGWLRSL
jgi:membrane protease YdiL (CAAX protease family)